MSFNYLSKYPQEERGSVIIFFLKRYHPKWFLVFFIGREATRRPLLDLSNGVFFVNYLIIFVHYVAL
jgi:hypothetical protein